MTVPSEEAFWGPFAGDGITTNFPFGGRIFVATDLVVTKVFTETDVRVVLAYPGEYSVTGVNNSAGGTVVLAAALGSGYSLEIERIVTLAQESDIINQGAFHAQIHEDAWDRLAMVDQQLQKQIDDIDDAGFTSNTPLPLSSSQGGTGTGTGSINVLELGASPAASATVNTAAIQAAIDYLVETGGGTVYFNKGVYQINNPIVINYSSIRLKGIGTGEIRYSIPQNSDLGTTLLWTGGYSIMIAAGPIVDAANYSLSGDEISGMTLDGGGTASVGLFLSSMNQCRFQDLAIHHCVDWCIDFDVTDPLTSPADSQHCHFDSIILDARDVVNTNCGGLRLGASAPATADVSVNLFTNLTVTVENGNAFDLVNCDTNYFCGIHCFVHGTGKSIRFASSEVSAFFTARNNRFYAFEPHIGPILSQGGSFPAMDNVVEFMTGNAAVQPTIESGSRLYYQTEQFSNRHGFLTLCVGDTYSTIADQKNGMDDESLRVYNLADAHIKFANLTATEWVMSMVNTDDFRIAPTASNPSIFLSDIAKLTSPGTDTYTGLLIAVNRGSVVTLDQVTVGAEDSGGSGKRVLVVDN
jgi:hypothetical protein